MEYPLNMTKAAKGNEPTGFAVANDKDEHAALSAAGYEPKLVAEAKKAKAEA